MQTTLVKSQEPTADNESKTLKLVSTFSVQRSAFIQYNKNEWNWAFGPF